MPAPIHSLLAQELDISDERAQKLLRAMLREVRKRAGRGGGVRIPNLGSFVVEEGSLSFTPSPSLARAVNHHYEGLESEDLSSAPEPRDEDEGPTTITLGFQSAGSTSPSPPSDSPSSSDDPDTDEFQSPDTDEFQSPDTDEFHPPDTGEFEAPETSEAPPAERATSDSDAADSVADSTPPAAPTDDASGPDTGELYPLVEDVPHASSTEPTTDASSNEPTSDPDADPDVDDDASPSSSPPDPASSVGAASPAADASPSGPPRARGKDDAPKDEVDETYESLKNVWASESAWDFSTVTDKSADDDTDDERSPARSTEEASHEDASDGDRVTPKNWMDEAGWGDEDTPDPDPTDTSDAASPEKTSAPAPSDADRDAKPQPPPRRSTSSSSSALPRVFVTLIILLLFGGVGWFVLGQQGYVIPPQQVLSQLTQSTNAPSTSPTAQNASETPTVSPDDASPSASPEDPTATSDATTESDDAPASPSDGAPGNATSNAAPTASTSDASTSDASTNDASATSSPPARSGIDRQAGGWTIIVASRTAQGSAEQLASTYQERFRTAGYPVDVLTATVDGQDFFRVAVGQFSSSDAARSALNQHGDKLPDGAWATRIQ